MYYEETLTKGKIHYRTSTKEKWQPLSKRVLSRRLVEAEQEVLNLKSKLAKLGHVA